MFRISVGAVCAVCAMSEHMTEGTTIIIHLSEFQTSVSKWSASQLSRLQRALCLNVCIQRIESMIKSAVDDIDLLMEQRADLVSAVLPTSEDLHPVDLQLWYENQRHKIDALEAEIHSLRAEIRNKRSKCDQFILALYQLQMEEPQTFTFYDVKGASICCVPTPIKLLTISSTEQCDLLWCERRKWIQTIIDAAHQQFRFIS